MITPAAQYLRDLNKPAVTAPELARALNIPHTSFYQLLHDEPEAQRPPFWQAGGMNFVTLETAIQWCDSIGVEWQKGRVARRRNGHG